MLCKKYPGTHLKQMLAVSLQFAQLRQLKGVQTPLRITKFDDMHCVQVAESVHIAQLVPQLPHMPTPLMMVGVE